MTTLGELLAQHERLKAAHARVLDVLGRRTLENLALRERLVSLEKSPVPPRKQRQT